MRMFLQICILIALVYIAWIASAILKLISAALLTKSGTSTQALASSSPDEPRRAEAGRQARPNTWRMPSGESSPQ
jgi:hypothetical protein